MGHRHGDGGRGVSGPQAFRAQQRRQRVDALLRSAQAGSTPAAPSQLGADARQLARPAAALGRAMGALAGGKAYSQRTMSGVGFITMAWPATRLPARVQAGGAVGHRTAKAQRLKPSASNCSVCWRLPLKAWRCRPARRSAQDPQHRVDRAAAGAAAPAGRGAAPQPLDENQLLALAQRRSVNSGNEQVQPDLAHRHQARVVGMARQRRLQLASASSGRAPRTSGGCPARRHRRQRCQRARTASKATGSTAGITHCYVFSSCPRTHGATSAENPASRWQ